MSNAQAVTGGQIEADDDATSDYEPSLGGTDTTSLTSTITDYVYENGRRYHRLSEGKYTLPNDETEQDRLDLTHHQQLLSLKGELYLAPIASNPQNILDAGTGTGIWALDMGEIFPSAKIIGVDLSPIQPSWVYPNVKFEVDDLENDWTWPWDHFDFIHSRIVGNSIRDWKRYIGQMFAHTKPGGWIELVEYEQGLNCDDGTFTKDTGLKIWIDAYLSCLKKAGVEGLVPDDYIQLLEKAGFTDCKVHAVKQPWGPWPKNPELKRLGAVTALISETGLEAYSLALLTRHGGCTHTEAKELCDRAQADIKGKKVHAYNNIWHVIARKPERI